MMESLNLQEIYTLGKDVLISTIHKMPDLNIMIYTLLVLIATYGIYHILFGPVNREWYLGDIGYDCFKEEAKKQGKKLKDFVKRVQSLKKKGQYLPPYPNGWYGIMESIDLRKGEVKSVSGMGQTYAVFRSKDGEAYVLDAYCPHLGTNIAMGGTLNGSCIKCPFHNWEFDGKTGECVKVPYSDKVPPHSNVKKWLSIERTGMIYIWFHAEDEEPSWFPPEIKEISNGELVYKGRFKLSLAAHIFDIGENIGDVAHFNQLHSTPIFTIFNFKIHLYPIFKFFFNCVWSEGEAPNTHTSTSKMNSTVSLFDKIQLLKFNSQINQYGSAIAHLDSQFTSFSRCLMIHTILPVSPLEQQLCIQIFSCYVPSILVSFFVHTQSELFEQDVKIWNFKKFAHKPVLVKEDSSIVQYRRWFAQFYSKNSLTVSNAKDSLYW